MKKKPFKLCENWLTFVPMPRIYGNLVQSWYREARMTRWLVLKRPLPYRAKLRRIGFAVGMCLAHSNVTTKRWQPTTKHWRYGLHTPGRGKTAGIGSTTSAAMTRHWRPTAKPWRYALI